jgi:hypothetical protein
LSSHRYAVAVTLALALLLPGWACGPSDRAPVRIVDLVREMRSAEARPSAAAFEVADVSLFGRSGPAIRTLAPSRLVFVLAIPLRSTFSARVAIDSSVDGGPQQPLRFRVGISDDRIYESLASVVLTPGAQTDWTELRADLSAYAGWQWSVFYRPGERRWRLVLGVDSVAGPPGRGVWSAPGIEGDRAAAREHVERAARLSH